MPTERIIEQASRHGVAFTVKQRADGRFAFEARGAYRNTGTADDARSCIALALQACACIRRQELSEALDHYGFVAEDLDDCDPDEGIDGDIWWHWGHSDGTHSDAFAFVCISLLAKAYVRVNAEIEGNR